MSFSESQLQQFKEFVYLSVATKLGIPDADLESVSELQKLILGKNQSIAAVLAAFLSTYDDWYQFHVRIDTAGKAGNMDAAESAELVRLIHERDGTRNNLLKGLAAATVV
jgi:hypothetical protein